MGGGTLWAKSPAPSPGSPAPKSKADAADAAARVIGGAMPTGTLPDTFHEAPVLADRVKVGHLPPVRQRLPAHPLVVQPVRRVGTYGGTWRRLASTGDIGLGSRLGYETLVRWDRDGKTVIPNIAWKLEIRDQARTFVLHLRPGMRWSDGHPFTSADFRYHYKYDLKNKMLSPVISNNLLVDGRLYQLETPDPYTVIIHFADSYGLFPQMLAFRGRQGLLFSPAHYLKQFHAAFKDKQKLDRKARQEGYTGWSGYYHNRANVEQNPDCPTLGAWKIKIPGPATRALAVRNPYYWKVDPAGHQLPYIDRISYITVLDKTVLNLKAIAGGVDFQSRRIDAANFTLFMKSRQRKGYRVNVGYSDQTACVYLNQSSRDPVLAPLLRNRKFRIALSLGINREQLNRMIYNGLAKIDAGIDPPADAYYARRYGEVSWLDYDPKKANRLLDELGLKRGLGGIRKLPNGEAFRKILHVFPSESGGNPEFWQLIASYWRELGLDFVVKPESGSLSLLQERNGNADFWCYAISGINWDIYPRWKVPISASSYFAPRYGRYYSTDGKGGIKPPPQYQRLVDWYKHMAATPDPRQRRKLGRRILDQWARQCYVTALLRQPVLTIISDRMHNVPEKILHSYTLMTPGYIGVEQFYLNARQEPASEQLWTQPAASPPPYLYRPSAKSAADPAPADSPPDS